jgi:hypothetical protein
VVVTIPTRRAGAERADLERAKSFYGQRTLWGVIAAVATFVALGALTLSGVALVLNAATVGSVMGVFAVSSGLLAVFGFLRTRRSAALAREAMAAAEHTVAQELLASSASVDRAQLSQMMHIAPERAEQLLAELSVDRLLDAESEEMRVRVEGDFSTEPEQRPEQRKRVD